ncbi:MAG: hypothetical protein ACYSTY_06925 [Planctomycetota bacterium]|jgi:hypothetical protein
MRDPRTDQIAREAARLIETGGADSIGQAIRAAADALGFHDAQLPGHGRVRMHAQGMSMQALGDAGYAEMVRDVWRTAERLMTVLAEATPSIEPRLVGRAAKGQIDAGVTLHIRAYTRSPIEDVARLLVEFGYGEPAFETVNTKVGRLNRLRLDDDGIEIVVTRCRPDMARRVQVNLFSGQPINTATLEEVRGKLGSK